MTDGGPHRGRTNGVPQGAEQHPGTRLRTMFRRPEPLAIMGAYDGVSALIAESEGFEALWASGLAVSTALGVRDSEEASWTQRLAAVESMCEAVSIPILVDGDAGHGNFNSARRFARKAERIGAAGVCIEDKVLPKMNSFVGDRHPLADITEFCGKLSACKEAQSHPAFCLVARAEGLIAGRSVQATLERAYAYGRAGADAIFIHSREATSHEIEAFARQWDGSLPLIVSPTTYESTPMETFRRSGISGVIWANQSMRASVAAMRRVCREMLATGRAERVELAGLGEIFELMRYEDLERDQRRFLPQAEGIGLDSEHRDAVLPPVSTGSG
jgi:phosphoenolpyruvate phosphomutase